MVNWPDLETTSPSPVMIEYNTISIGGLGITTKAGSIHKYIASKYSDKIGFAYGNFSDAAVLVRQDPQFAGQLYLDTFDE